MTTPADPSGKTAVKPAGATAPSPIIIDLGKKSRKKIRRAREGTGELMDEINVTLDELRADGTIKADAQPVLIIVRQKPRKKSFSWPLSD
jgi:Family of unknown function (DUF6200)